MEKISLEMEKTEVEGNAFRSKEDNLIKFKINKRNPLLGANQMYCLWVSGYKKPRPGHNIGEPFNEFVGYMIDLDFGKYRITYKGENYIMHFEEDENFHGSEKGHDPRLKVTIKKETNNVKA